MMMMMMMIKRYKVKYARLTFVLRNWPIVLSELDVMLVRFRPNDTSRHVHVCRSCRVLSLNTDYDELYSTLCQVCVVHVHVYLCVLWLLLAVQTPANPYSWSVGAAVRSASGFRHRRSGADQSAMTGVFENRIWLIDLFLYRPSKRPVTSVGISYSICDFCV